MKNEEWKITFVYDDGKKISLLNHEIEALNKVFMADHNRLPEKDEMKEYVRKVFAGIS